jgi:hypothetical protein
MKIRSRLFTCLTLAALCTVPVFALAPNALATKGASAIDGKPIKGKVLETMDSGGYTYINMEVAGGNVWVAVPQAKVEKGKEITCNPGMVMNGFQSKTLNRTFDTIVFSSGVAGDKGANAHGGMAMGGMGGGSSFADAMKAEHGGAPMGGPAMGAPAGASGSANNIVPSEDITVDKASGDNAYTVSECFEQSKDLNNKKVKVQGKVVKVSMRIMGKNWLHIQDGSGDPTKNTHDLVVTTMAEPAINSVVVIEGDLHANKDFGAGYKYNVIIEDAEVK